MRRSDNFPFVGTLLYPCSGDGEFYVFVGFPVQSATVTPAGLPEGAQLVASGKTDDKGFWITHKGIPESPGYAEFTFTAQ